MNPLLGRLYESKSRSKAKAPPLLPKEETRRANSQERPLVPRIGTHKVKLESLPEPQIEKRLSTLVKGNVGRLPTLTHRQTTHEIKEKPSLYSSIRGRKFSSSIREMEITFFPTEFDEPQRKGSEALSPHYQKMMAVSPSQKKMTEQEYTPAHKLKQEEPEQEMFEYLKVLENNEDLNQQFCYMNRRQLPYSYYIVDYEERNPAEYLTVSLRGITVLKDEQQQEFSTIPKFARELDLYKKIKQIPFFRDYLVMKVTQHWKSIMLRRKFKLKCKYISSHLFSQNMILQEYLHFLHNLAVDYSGGNFFNFHITLTLSLEQFNKVAEAGRTELLKSVRKFDHIIQKNLRASFDKLMTKFRLDERVTLGTGDKKKDEAFLPFDSKKRSMKYTQMAKLKEFEWMIYRMIKYSDMLRFNVKLDMVRKCYHNSIADLANLKRASQDKEAIRLVNWIDMVLTIEGEPGGANLKLNPSIQQIGESIVENRQEFLMEMFKDHKLMIEKRESLMCENLQLDEDESNKPSRYDLKYYVMKQPQFTNLQTDFQTALKLLLTKIQQLYAKANDILLQIYNKNALKGDIQNYLSNQALEEYLRTYRKDYDDVMVFEQSAQYALVLVRMGAVREQVRTIAEEKFKVITSAVPNEVIRRSQVLEDRIRSSYNKVKENPHKVAEYLTFSQNYIEVKMIVPELQAEMDQIQEYERLVYSYGIRIGEAAKNSIADVSVLLKELMKRMDDIDENEEKERKKFENMTEDMIPGIEQKAEELLKQIKENNIINNHTSEIGAALNKLQEFIKSYQKLLGKKNRLFEYQRQLALGHRQLEQYERMEGTVKCLEEVWKTRVHYLKVLEFSQKQGYGKIAELDLQPLESFLASTEKYYSHLECFDLLAEFKQSTVSLLKVIKLSELLTTPTLTPQHIDQLKTKIKAVPGSSIKPELLFGSTSKNSVSPQRISKETNVPELQSQISEVVFLSTQENIVKSQLTQIEEYWRKTKVCLISEDIAQNQQPILHLDDNQELHEKIGSFVVVLKNIEMSSHVVGIAHERAQLNGKICLYMRQLLWMWAKVEKQWRSLLPVMANYQAVKHQSNVYFDFNNADVLIKKFIRLISQMLSLRRLCEDHKERKYMSMLEQAEKYLCSVSKNFSNFLDTKRVTYGRFCFMSDQELVQMLQNVKDSRSVSKFIPCCFFSDRIRLDGQVMAAFESKHEDFKTRMVALKGQPQQIFKSIEENMKQSIKSMVKKIYPRIKIGIKPAKLISEVIIQVILVCDRMLWTEMSEQYLTTSTYDEYKLLIRKEEQAILGYLHDATKQKWIHTAIRATQLMHLREVGMELIRQQITSADFKWKQQLRMYGQEDDIFVYHFDGKLPYLCEYRPPTHLAIPTGASTRYLYESYRAVQWGSPLVVGGHQGEGKRNLVMEASAMLGSYSREVICSSKLSITFLLKIVQGVIAASAWVSFYEFDNLNYSVCAQLLATLHKINPIEQRSYSLFTLIYHGKQVQQISTYAFLNFSVMEPERQRVCEWMLRMYKFKNETELTQRICKYLKVVKPFRHRAFGSQLSVINKVIIKAGSRLLELEHSDQQIQRKLIAEALRELVIHKEEQTKSQCLNIALKAHFEVSLEDEATGGQFGQKVQTLVSLLKSGAEGVIVLGQRSCKSTAIKAAAQRLQYQTIWLYPQAREVFFTPDAIDFMRDTTNAHLVVYDANEMIVQWSDLMTAGHLFIEGRRAVLESQAVMELRSIENCSPSFVGKCQIVYMGGSVVSRWDKLKTILPQGSPNREAAIEIMQEMYGKELQALNEDIFLKLIKFMASIEVALPAKQLEKLIAWLQALLGNESTWIKIFGGSCYDMMLNVNYELLPVNVNYFSVLQYEGLKKYLLVPTRATTVIMLTINQLLQAGMGVHVIGDPRSGKTSLKLMLAKRMEMSSRQSAEEWSEALKKRLTYVRREGADWLLDLEKEGVRLVVDDMDLGMPSHLEYVRELVEQRAFRDRTFKDYRLEAAQVISMSRSMPIAGKYWSYVAKLKLPLLDKDAVGRIFQQNMNQQITDFNMNRDVVELITSKIIKACLITVDDLTGIIGSNQASTLMLALLRNLLSLPKRQGHCSLEQYKQFFRTNYHLKMHEKSHNDKLRYQIKLTQQNILKVIFRGGKLESFMLNLDGQYRSHSIEQLTQMINKQVPDIVIFDRLLETVVYLINQIRCIDDSVILLGRRGTGKRFLIQLVAKIAKVTFATNFSEAVLGAIKHQRIIYVEQIQAGTGTFYEEFTKCKIDKDLQKLIDAQKRDVYYSSVAGQDYKADRLVERCQQYITFLFLCDQKQSYRSFSNRRREVLNMPVCLVEEWPAEAILNLYTINDPQPAIHANLFTKVNAFLSRQKVSTVPLKVFEKYLKIFYEINGKMAQTMEIKYKLHKDIHYKFNESFELVSAWEQRVDQLRTQIQEAIIKSGQNIVANQVANMCLVIFLDQIKEEEQKTAKEEAELKILKYQIEKRLQLIKKVMIKIEKIVSSFQRHELSQLKKIYKANRVVYFGVQCLCILLRQQNHDQKTINHILADPNLLMRMKAPQVLENRNQELQAKFKKELQSYTKDIAESQYELAKTLIEWIKSIIEYWQTCEKQRNEEAKYTQAKASLDESIRKHTELKTQVAYIKNIIQEKLSIVEGQLQFKANREVEFNSISKRLDNATKIIPMLKNEQIEAKAVLDRTLQLQNNLRGNCILAAFTAAFLSMRTLSIKQQLLQLAKQVLKHASIPFSETFMADISDKQIDSLQSLNYFMLEGCSLPKVVFDPQRKFLNFLDDENASEQMKESVVENAENKVEVEAGKIYHVTGQWKGNKDKVLIVDWSQIAIDEKDAIFLRIAAFKRPEYFQVKKQLQIKINRNLFKVRKLKESLYGQISEKKMKIIQDDSFRVQGEELRKLQEETVELKELAAVKLKQIEHLTEQINEEATKVITIYRHMKHYKAVDLDVILDACCRDRQGDNIHYLIRWALSNLHGQHHLSFLIWLVYDFTKESRVDIIKDIITKTQPKLTPELLKSKKPALVSVKHWQLALKLSSYGGAFSNMLDGVSKCQKQFEQWCINQTTIDPPTGVVSGLGFAEHLVLLVYFRSKNYGFLAFYLIKRYLPNYKLFPLRFSQIFSNTQYKFPLLTRFTIEQLKKHASDLNESRCHLARISKINNQSEMKKVVWRSMESKEWLVCYDYHSKKDLQMLESICYYVMNYDKQIGFKVIIVVDYQPEGDGLTAQQKLLKSSSFLTGVCVNLYPEEPSYEQIVAETNPIQYQISIVGNNSSTFSNKQIFNKLYRAIILCYSVAVRKHPKLRLVPIKRIIDTLNYIKIKNIPVEFNIFTIVDYIGYMMGNVVGDSDERRQVEELWNYLVDERKVVQKKLMGVNLEGEGVDEQVRDNYRLAGWQQSEIVRQKNSKFQIAMTELSQIFKSGSSVQEELAFVRHQIGRLPAPISHKEASNPHFAYFYNRELQLHNKRLSKVKQMLEQLNQASVRQNYLQTLEKSERQKLLIFVEDLSLLHGKKIPVNALRPAFMDFVNRLKRQHDYLLYFNPKLPTLVIDPCLLNHLGLFVSTFFIDRYCQKLEEDAYKLETYFSFGKSNNQKDIFGQGIFIANLNYKEFHYHHELKSVSANLQIDGIDTAPIIHLKFNRPRQEEGQQIQDLDVEICSSEGKPILSGNLEYSTVFVEWGLRRPCLVSGGDVSI